MLRFIKEVSIKDIEIIPSINIIWDDLKEDKKTTWLIVVVTLNWLCFHIGIWYEK